MIVSILPQYDEFLEPVYTIINRLEKIKIVKHHDIVLNLLTIPSDIPFATKVSGDNTDDNSFVTIDTNSFITSNSKQSYGRLRRS